MTSQKNILWTLVFFLLAILMQNYSYGQYSTPATTKSNELNLPTILISEASVTDDTSSLQITHKQHLNRVEPIIKYKEDSRSALKAGQLQNIRKIYQFEHEIYNEILQNQKKLNMT